MIYASLVYPCLNHLPAQFLKWNNAHSISGTLHLLFKGYQDENLNLVSHWNRAWLVCMDMKAGMALY